MGQQWTCPYCSRPCTVGDSDVREMSGHRWICQEYGYYLSSVKVVVCPNPECRQQTIFVAIYKSNDTGGRKGEPIFSWNLLPESEAKPFPDYIPKQLRDDYAEACLIRTKSPKASATLSRRCLQGMIRDFWGINKGRLVDEINELQEKIDLVTWDAINSVRHVGNIGAHMEKDVNLIIDVEPDEAGLLIWLIETLMSDWYVQRHERQQRMAGLVAMAEEKKQKKFQPVSSPNR